MGLSAWAALLRRVMGAMQNLTVALCTSLQRMDSRIWPMSTRAQVPCGLPKAPRMPVCGGTAELRACSWQYNAAPSRAGRSRLQPVGARAGEHLVDAQHVEGVHAHAQVEGVLARVLHHVLVSRDTRSLQRLAGDLLLLPAARAGHGCWSCVVLRSMIGCVHASSSIGAGKILHKAVAFLQLPCRASAQENAKEKTCPPYKVDAEWVGVHGSPLGAHIIDANFRVWHTTAVPRLGVRLVLDLPVAPGRPCSSTQTRLL